MTRILARHVGRSLFVVGACLLLGCAADAVPDAAEQPISDDDATEAAGGEEIAQDESELFGVGTTTTTTTVSAAALLAKVTACTKKASASPYARDVGGTANIHVCAAKNAVFYKADLDIDCDGKKSAQCNKSTDASYQSETATTDSKGQPLDAAKLPFVVMPGVSSRWSYKAAGVSMGSVALVIYNGKIEYGIVGDVGPQAIIGEASYAMAKNLGINPNPSTGGIDNGVTYIVFTGSSGIVTKKEDHAAAVATGKKRAAQFLSEN